MVEITYEEQNKIKIMKRTEDSLRDPWDNIKCTIRIIGAPEKEEKKKEEIVNQIQEAQRVPDRINPRRNTPRHILNKLRMIKHKERV